MNRYKFLSGAVLILGVSGLAGCSSSESQEYTVGNPSNIVTPESADDPGEMPDSDVPVIDVKVTELPQEWPSGVVPPQGSTIENVVVLDEQITVSWIIPSGNLMDRSRDFSNILNEAGFDVGESEATESYGKGAYSSDTHVVEFILTPLTESNDQLYVTFKPLASDS